SPCTTTRDGRRRAYISVSRGITRQTISLRDWSGRMMSRSWSGVMPKGPRIWSTISRCCPVTARRTRRRASEASACTTGKSLIASGRVPRTTRTSGVSAKGALLAHPADDGTLGGGDGAGVLLERHHVVGGGQALQHLLDELDLGGRRQIHPGE